MKTRRKNTTRWKNAIGRKNEDITEMEIVQKKKRLKNAIEWTNEDKMNK